MAKKERYSTIDKLLALSLAMTGTGITPSLFKEAGAGHIGWLLAPVPISVYATAVYYPEIKKAIKKSEEKIKHGIKKLEEVI